MTQIKTPLSSEAAVWAEQLRVERGGKAVLHDVSFRIEPGEIVAILGRSGGGKSTLLGAVAGFFPSVSGFLKTPERIGYCFQNNSLFRFMTVRENIAFGLGDFLPAERQGKSLEVLRKIGLEDWADRYPAELSGGQQQRVALGRAIAYGPELLLLDEPFSALDIFTRDQMISWVSDLIRSSLTTTMLVTHYLDEALLLSDRIFILRDGVLGEEIWTTLSKKEPMEDVRFSESFQRQKQHLQQLLMF